MTLKDAWQSSSSWSFVSLHFKASLSFSVFSCIAVKWNLHRNCDAASECWMYVKCQVTQPPNCWSSPGLLLLWLKLPYHVFAVWVKLAEEFNQLPRLQTCLNLEHFSEDNFPSNNQHLSWLQVLKLLRTLQFYLLKIVLLCSHMKMI